MKSWALRAPTTPRKRVSKTNRCCRFMGWCYLPASKEVRPRVVMAVPPKITSLLRSRGDPAHPQFLLARQEGGIQPAAAVLSGEDVRLSTDSLPLRIGVKKVVTMPIYYAL
jgi:hypothetical protein